jgi:hypothetical protein
MISTFEPLSKRDKAAIQMVTRYSNVMRDKPYEFEIRHGRVHFGKSGTTSHARFDTIEEDPQAIQGYLTQLAVFAFQRLARIYGVQSRFMILNEVAVYGDKQRYSLRLGELVLEHFDKPIYTIVAEAERS